MLLLALSHTQEVNADWLRKSRDQAARYRSCGDIKTKVEVDSLAGRSGSLLNSGSDHGGSGARKPGWRFTLGLNYCNNK